MSKTEINNALSKGRSQHVGQAIDDSIILELVNSDIVYTDGGETSPLTTIMQKLSSGTEKILGVDVDHEKIKSIHIPPQITTIETDAFVGTVICEKINLENIMIVKNHSFSGLAVQREQPIKINLNNIIEIGEDAFGDANAIIYLNENVEDVSYNAFVNTTELHYKGNLPNAPWGALNWIKD